MRVTHVITRLIVGGAQENTITSVLGLRQKPGLDVRLISGPSLGAEGSLESAAARAGLRVQLSPHLVRPVHPWHDALAFRDLARTFGRERPDLLHTHSGKAGFLGRLAAARARVPLIVHTLHGPSFGGFQGPLANTLFRAAERRAGAVTTHFVSVAEAMTRQYLAAGIGRPEQYSLIYSGFDLQPFLAADNSPRARERWGLAASDLVIGKIARLFKLKGHDDLFAVAGEIVRQCPQARFLLVGDGPWRARFEDLARERGLERHFVFTGLVPPGEVPALVGIMDVLVHLSRREGLPRALPQALAAARPVVAWDCDGAKEVCIDGETGFLLPPGDRAALQSRILQLARDPALREKLGKRGQDWVRERFAAQAMVDQLHELYLKLARARGIPHP
jgi:glycosyltransferase involved in cell wall biosynthesis